MSLNLLLSFGVQAIFFLLLTALLHKSSFAIRTTPSTFSRNDTDRLALLAIKSMILHDPQGALSSWNDSLHFCQWQGVQCGPPHERVTVLDLSSRGLVGSLSPYVGNLSFLTGMWLQNNTLGGGIPPEIGRLFRLNELRLWSNFFEGEIPANISHCSNLTLLGLARNRLVGKIPEELGSLSKVKDIWLHFNNLTGVIPPSIGNLTSLETFSTVDNRLTGIIPDVFGRQLKNLRELTLGANQLSGVIPPSLYNLSLLTLISLSYNQFHGDLPPGLGFMLPHLQTFQLSGNQFTGPLPQSLANASGLSRIDLAINNFTGKISINFGSLQNLSGVSLGQNNLGSGELDEMSFITSLGNCSNLQVLELASNQLRGALPYDVGNFSTQLFYLSLTGNRVHGDIPSWIGDIVSLTQLSLNYNEFRGTIPANVGNLRMLQRLELETNSLSGELPSSVGSLSLLIELRLNNNKLQGNIPSSLGNCQKLLLLDLSQNNLSGTIPKQILGISTLSISLNLSHNRLFGSLPLEVGGLINLVGLDVSENDLSAEIPNRLGRCASLESLNLEGNFFQGSIPPSLSSLRGIQILDFSRNNLSGQIPEFLENLSLRNLNLSYNDFEGEVPTKGAFVNTSVISVAGNNRLCGGIPELKLSRCTITVSKKRKFSQVHLLLIIIILCMLLGVIVVSASLYFLLKKKQRAQSSESLLNEPFLNVSYDKLLKATDGFSSTNLLGVGGFGSVYKGILAHEERVVAVKVLDLQRRGASRSFMAECEALRNIRHRNLVKIITSCSSIDFQGNDFKALVYEFMPSGSLEKWLHSSRESDNGQDEPQTLNLHQRVNIATDVACALDYLHHSCEKPIIHCDLKPSNILLDGDMVAHVADFGLARFLTELPNPTQSSTLGIRGTIGYTAPEYGLGSDVSTKGDVYSYGIFVLEMMTGRKPTDSMFEGGLNLHKFAKMRLPDRVREVMDPILLQNDEEEKAAEAATTAAANDSQRIIQEINGNRMEECLISMIKIGVACSMESPQDRMDISNVVRELHSVRKMLSRGTELVPNA